MENRKVLGSFVDFCHVIFTVRLSHEYNKKIPSPLVSFLPIVLLIGMLFATIRTFGSDALSGGSQISLLTTTAVLRLYRRSFLPDSLERLRNSHYQQCGGSDFRHYHTADYRCAERRMDD